jgi:hypothetical protein
MKRRNLAIVPGKSRGWKSYDAEDRYEEVLAELRKKFRGQQFSAGGLLQQVVQEKLFGSWGTFKAFVEGELRISERSAYRLIFANQMTEVLKAAGCKILPVNERQLRPLSALDSEKEQILAWKRATANKQKSSPTHIDVQREVNRLFDPKTDTRTDENFRQYREYFWQIRRELNRATKMVADGDLESFLMCTDKRSQEQKARLAHLIQRLGLELGDHFNRFRVFPPNPIDREK